MGMHDALIAGWNNASKPSGATLPANVTVGSLLTGMTTLQKIDAINAWGLFSPQKAILSASALLNAVAPTDLENLTGTQIALFQLLLQGGGLVDASAGTSIRAVAQNIFAGKTTTLANLAALVSPYDNATVPWVSAPVAQGGAGETGALYPNYVNSLGLS
jgi:hypothetical protein